MASPRKDNKGSDESNATKDSGVAFGSTDTEASAADSTLPLLEPPGDIEAARYYYGLPSLPRLVGRTTSGVRPWAEFRYQDPLDAGYEIVACRCATPIGGPHVALQRMEAILPRIRQALGGLPWTCIDLVRLGLNTVPVHQRPVVLWIGLQPAAWAEVARALRAVRRVLDGAGLGAVECEMRETSVVLLQGPPVFAPVRGEEAFVEEGSIKQAISSALGQGIFPAGFRNLNGTLGVYVRPAREDDPPIWGLTCRHVALPLDNHPNERYERRRDTRQQQTLYLPTDAVLNSVGRTADHIVEYTRELLDEARQRNESDYEIRRREARLAAARNTLGALQGMRPVENRAFGKVMLSPPLSAAGDPVAGFQRAWTRDWALVNVQRSKFPAAYTRNEVDLRTKFAVAEMHDLADFLRDHAFLPPDWALPREGLLPIRRVVPLSELDYLCSGRAEREAAPYWLVGATAGLPAPPVRTARDMMEAPHMFDKAHARVLVVGKRGTASGLTWGAVNEFLSVTRHCHVNAVFESRELAVIGFHQEQRRGEVARQQAAFSAPGDSGALVFDLCGRAVGLLTGGTTMQAGFLTDVTYCTPMELILDDISRGVGRDVRLL